MIHGNMKSKTALLLVLTMLLSIISPGMIRDIHAEAVGRDLGNIFTFKTLKLGDKDSGTEIEDSSVVDISDGTEIYLEYSWDTATDVKAGDWSEIEVPNAFMLDRDWENLDIVLSGGQKVGKYSLIDGKLRFVFDEGIENIVGEVRNGFVGFGLKFNLDVFSEDVNQKIEFKDKTGKELNITAKPSSEIEAIEKSGIPDSTKDAKEIYWTIDIVNIEENAIINASIKDAIPEGLALKDGSVEVKSLKVGYSGGKTEGDTTEPSSLKTEDRSLEATFDSIAPYSGYRIKYTTTIEDYSKTAFTNDATLSYGEKSLPAASTVSGIERSDFIEKSGRYIEVDGEIEWTIDVNKAGGTIGKAIVEDALPAGLSIKNGTLAIYRLNQSGSSWSESLDQEKTDKVSGFPIDLGELGSGDTYRIKFRTTIDYTAVNSGNYEESHDFENKATLKDEGSFIGESEKTVTVERKPLLEKSGKSSVNYNDKFIDWTIHVNRANHKIVDAKIVDRLPAGLSIVSDSIEIYDSEGEKLDGITPSIVGDAITVELGDIEEYYRVEYRTKIDNFSENEFKNRAVLSGTGVGIEVEKSATVRPPGNSYAKSFKAIDYNEKTMSWEIVVNPAREPITELKITDSFPNGGLIMLPDSLTVKLGSEVLEKDTNYTIKKNESSYGKGFILEFKMGVDEEINDKVTISYNTSYDPEARVEGDSPEEISESADGKYKNSAKFEGKTKSENAIDISRDAEKKVIDSSWNSGKKEGRLVSIDAEGEEQNGWTSGYERKLRWEVYINYLEQKLGTGVRLEDSLGYEGEIEESSIEVRTYSVSANGSTSVGEKLDSSNYSVSMDDDKRGFTLEFSEGFSVEGRYVVVYKTSVPDISEAKYTNEAKLFVGETEYPYMATIAFDRHDKVLSKEALGVANNKVYTDEELSWRIAVNESLSLIEDARVVDTISPGLIYKGGSLKVYKLEGAQKKLVDENKYNLEVENEGESTKLTLDFKQKIDATYFIEYMTLVVATGGEVYNKAEFSGSEITTKAVETPRLKASQFTFVGGDPSRGKINVSKVDSNGDLIEDSQAKFKLWYNLNGEDYQFGNEVFETEGGKLEIVNLPLNRTYYLEEVEAPKGYVINPGLIAIRVENASGGDGLGAYEAEVVNEKIKANIEFEKVSEDGEKLKGAVFGLFGSSGEKIVESTSDEDGKVKFKSVEYGEYTIKEISPPEGYLTSDEVLSVSVGDEDDGKTVSPNKSEFTNQVKRGNIEIRKRDTVSKEALKGAEIGVYTEMGELVDSKVTGDTGRLIFEDLEYGRYYYSEIKSPSGYTLDRSKYYFDIEEDGVTLEAYLDNKKASSPGSPGKPVEPDDPSEPENPEDSEDIEKPTRPGEPDNPSKPEDPDGPSDSESPEDSENTEGIEKPSRPGDVDEPTSSEETDGNVNSGNPQKPGNITGGVASGSQDSSGNTGNLDGNNYTEEQSTAKLPKTGHISSRVYYVSGVLLLAIGIFTRKKKAI